MYRSWAWERNRSTTNHTEKTTWGLEQLFDSFFHLVMEPGLKFFLWYFCYQLLSTLVPHTYTAVTRNVSLEWGFDHLHLLLQKLHSSHKIKSKHRSDLVPSLHFRLSVSHHCTEVHSLLKLNWTFHCFPSMPFRTLAFPQAVPWVCVICSFSQVFLSSSSDYSFYAVSGQMPILPTGMHCSREGSIILIFVHSLWHVNIL